MNMKKANIRWRLVSYDILVLLFVEYIFVTWLDHSTSSLTPAITFALFVLTFCLFIGRFVLSVYEQIWRYGGVESYLRLILADAIGFVLYMLICLVFRFAVISYVRMFAITCAFLLITLFMRLVYRYAYKCGSTASAWGRFLNSLLVVFADRSLLNAREKNDHRVRVVIIGAGRVGVALAEELKENPSAIYQPICFVDINPQKIGRHIMNLPVLADDETLISKLMDFDVQEVIFAVPDMEESKKEEFFHVYRKAGYKVMIYDYPVAHTPGSKRSLREFDIEDLLSRPSVVMNDAETHAYYRDKVILITGGGGSIGSEICRQLAPMHPRKLIVLDICENGAYDVQQDLKIAYGNQVNICIEICSITNRSALDRVMEIHRPQIVIHAAAHKHVPLMEHNCIEAVENNVFGTLNVVECCEKHGVEAFIMVSTDKAVNPTNVMGATKRLCEMIVQSFSRHSGIKYSATRFGNVLGSAGSVIPLFKKQIAAGGPVTVTDRRINRYFMTIPEASQLVLQSGAMAQSGELFVLDMGQPVKIWDLAERMVRLSGADHVEIIETGLRPGEKLYEETLVQTEELDKTSNNLIYIERDSALTPLELDRRLDLLRDACKQGDDEKVREVMHQVVPTYKTPEEVNAEAIRTQKVEENEIAV